MSWWLVVGLAAVAVAQLALGSLTKSVDDAANVVTLIGVVAAIGFGAVGGSRSRWWIPLGTLPSAIGGVAVLIRERVEFAAAAEEAAQHGERIVPSMSAEFLPWGIAIVVAATAIVAAVAAGTARCLRRRRNTSRTSPT